MIASVAGKLADPRSLSESDVLETIYHQIFESSTGNEEWSITRTPPWLYVEPFGCSLPDQGWKIHISATEQQAPKILSACLPILKARRLPFKFILTLALVRLFNSSHAPRRSSGKFITIYPRDVEDFRDTAFLCHAATVGFNGPAVLTDKPLHPGSLVYYRYGAFKAMHSYNVYGRIVYSLKRADGSSEEDIRSVSAQQPSWTIDPLDSEVSAAPAQKAPLSVLLNQRYAVSHAIQHANKGGVYSAIDGATQEEIVIKEARPHVETDDCERDATDRLRREARNLELLRTTGIAPCPIEVFSQSGHFFLAMQRIGGVTLREYVKSKRRQHTMHLAGGHLLSLSRKVAALLQTCHSHGLVIRDFTPNNIMIVPAGHLFLVDLEMACPPGEADPIGAGEGTIGYASRQQLAEEVPDFSDDAFSLGAVLFFMATFRDPVFGSDRSSAPRPLHERVALYLDHFLRGTRIPTQVADVIRTNLTTNAADRWSTDRVFRHLAEGKPESRHRNSAKALPRQNAEHIHTGLTESAGSIIEHIVSTFDFKSSDRPIPATCFGEQTHPCSIQHGTAGVGLALVAHAQATGSSAYCEALNDLCQWTLAHSEFSPNAPMGLYFGLAGTSWFLIEAAKVLQDDELFHASMNLAQCLPCAPQLSDITHGAAGIGLTMLHFYHQSGQSKFLEKAHSAAEHLVRHFSFTSDDGSLLWVNSQCEDSDPKTTYYGFAHGISGIAYFFLCLYLSTQDPTFLSMVERTAHALFAAAAFEGRRLYWSHGPTLPTRWPHWCNGSSGVGTFLVRFAQVVGSRQAFDLAVAASRAVMHERWLSACGQCHGLAGNGEYLLDLAHFTNRHEFFDAALEVAEIIDLHKIHCAPGMTVPDDSGLPLGIDYGTGASGVSVFFSRLSSQLPRTLMLDYLLPLRASSPVSSQPRDSR